MFTAILRVIYEVDFGFVHKRNIVCSSIGDIINVFEMNFLEIASVQSIFYGAFKLNNIMSSLVTVWAFWCDLEKIYKCIQTSVMLTSNLVKLIVLWPEFLCFLIKVYRLLLWRNTLCLEAMYNYMLFKITLCTIMQMRLILSNFAPYWFVD